MTPKWFESICSRPVPAVIVARSCPHPSVLFSILTYKSSLALVTLLSFYSSDHLYTFFSIPTLSIQKYVEHSQLYSIHGIFKWHDYVWYIKCLDVENLIDYLFLVKYKKNFEGYPEDISISYDKMPCWIPKRGRNQWWFSSILLPSLNVKFHSFFKEFKSQMLVSMI